MGRSEPYTDISSSRYIYSSKPCIRKENINFNYSPSPIKSKTNTSPIKKSKFE